MVRNTFFNLYCYNEFIKDTYETNKVKHFELILSGNGFELSSQGVPAKLAKETRSQQSQVVQELNEELFTQYLETDQKSDPKFQKIYQAIEYLKMPFSPEHLIKHKELILDKWKLSDHDTAIRF